MTLEEMIIHAIKFYVGQNDGIKSERYNTPELLYMTINLHIFHKTGNYLDQAEFDRIFSYMKDEKIVACAPEGIMLLKKEVDFIKEGERSIDSIDKMGQTVSRIEGLEEGSVIEEVDQPVDCVDDLEECPVIEEVDQTVSRVQAVKQGPVIVKWNLSDPVELVSNEQDDVISGERACSVTEEFLINAVTYLYGVLKVLEQEEISLPDYPLSHLQAAQALIEVIEQLFLAQFMPNFVELHSVLDERLQHFEKPASNEQFEETLQLSAEHFAEQDEHHENLFNGLTGWRLLNVVEYLYQVLRTLREQDIFSPNYPEDKIKEAKRMMQIIEQLFLGSFMPRVNSLHGRLEERWCEIEERQAWDKHISEVCESYAGFAGPGFFDRSFVNTEQSHLIEGVALPGILQSGEEKEDVRGTPDQLERLADISPQTDIINMDDVLEEDIDLGKEKEGRMTEADTSREDYSMFRW